MIKLNSLADNIKTAKKILTSEISKEAIKIADIFLYKISTDDHYDWEYKEYKFLGIHYRKPKTVLIYNKLIDFNLIDAPEDKFAKKYLLKNREKYSKIFIKEISDILKKNIHNKLKIISYEESYLLFYRNELELRLVIER